MTEQTKLIEGVAIEQMQWHMLSGLPHGELEVMVDADHPYLENYLSGPHLRTEDGDVISIMPALPELPLTLSAEQVAQAQEMHDALYAFWGVLPAVVQSSSGLQELLRASGARLEAEHFLNGRAPELPFLLKSDALLTTEGQLYIIDPNEVPLGLAALHGVYEAWLRCQGREDDAQLHAFVQAIQERVGDKTLAVVTKSRGWLNHRYVVNMLRHYGINALLLTPEMLQKTEDGLIDINGNRIDMTWVYSRYAQDASYSAADSAGMSALLESYHSGQIGLINQPGTRVFGANYWPALLQQPVFQDYLGSFLPESTIAVLADMFPESYLLHQHRDQGIVELQFCTNGHIAAIPYEKKENMGKKWLLKMPDSTGAKGVFMLNPTYGGVESTLAGVSSAGNSPFILQRRMTCMPNRYPELTNHKLEFWYVNGSTGLELMSTAVMVAAQQKVHGGSGTYYNVIENR